MVAPHHFSRIDTSEIKAHIYGKIGNERAEKYFEILSCYLGLKLSKVDFNKRCVETIGRENISLHNQLIRSIVQNAARATVPPPKVRKVEGLGVKIANNCERNSLQSVYGNAFPQSPRKCRSPAKRERKFRDRPSPLGPLGKSPSVTCEETISRLQEESAAEMQSLSSKPPANEDGEEVEQVPTVPSREEVEQVATIPSSPPWSHITAPFGVPTHKIDGVPKYMCPGFSYNSVVENCQSNNELPDTISLRSHMQKKLASEEIEVSLGSANLLNKSLDVFLKRLLEPCIGIAQSRCTDPRKLGQQTDAHIRSGFSGPFQNGQFSVPPSHASMLDFRVAMDSNPSILGANWPIQLEKIFHHE